MASQANIHIYQGDDYTAEIAVTNPDGSAADLTGYTVQSEIRSNYSDNSEPPFMQFQCTVSGNLITLLLTHDQTKVFTSTGYLWDLQLIDPAGWITTILAGRVMVIFGVS